LNLWQELTLPQYPATWAHTVIPNQFDSAEGTTIRRANVDTKPRVRFRFSPNTLPEDFVTHAGTVRWDFFGGSSRTSLNQWEIFPDADFLRYFLAVGDMNRTALGSYSWPNDSEAPLRLLDRFERELADWSGYLNPRHVASITRSINRLLADEEAFDDEGEKPSYNSFVEMLEFLTAHAWATAPMVTIDRRGFLAVLWRAKREDEADLILTFVGDGTIQWHVCDARKSKRKPFAASGVSERKNVWEDIPRRVTTEEWLAP
jgi:hypothetical protein